MKVLAALIVLFALADATVFGPSGIVRPDGNNVQFTRDQADYIVLVGPSGAITKDGRNIQFAADGSFDFPPLPISRARRSTTQARALHGPSGMITAEGIPIQFSKAGVYVVADGPSGIVLSDGTLIQKTL